MKKPDSLEFCIDRLISDDNNSNAEKEEQNKQLEGFKWASIYDLFALWTVIIIFAAAYLACYLLKIEYASIKHAQAMYTIFVCINVFSAVMALHSWSRIPSRSIAKDAALFLTISISSAAIGNSIDFLFWIFNVAPFKQSIFTNLFFVFAILFALPGVHLFGRICKVEFSKLPLVFYSGIILIYFSIPILMNPQLLANFSNLSNMKEFLFGMLYATGIGYLASISLHLWRNAQGRLHSSARLIGLSLLFLSFGCAVYAGLFPRTPLVEIPSSPVHIILALGYIAGAIGIRKTDRSINEIFNLKDSKLPPALHLIEIFGPSKGLEVYRKMESHIRSALEELLQSKAESEMKQKVIGSLENEISLRKKTELELILEKEKAEEANRTKTQFLAMMSHELKTPLTAIKGFGQILETSILNRNAPQPSRDKMGEIATQIVRNSNQLQIMIDSILRFSHLESGQFTYLKEEFALAELVEFASSLMEMPQFESARFSCVAKDPNILLNTDKLALQHIISNLLMNAYKFCKDGRITLEFRISDTDLFISVTDNGIGIAAEDMDKIFEAFYQVSHGNRRKFGGAGLGLSIVKRITEELEGKIFVSSEPGEGTTFDILFSNIVNSKDTT